MTSTCSRRMLSLPSITLARDGTCGSNPATEISPAGAAVRSAARNLAERARGLCAISASAGTTGRLVRMRKVGGACTISGRCREPPPAPPRSARKVLTIRSSSEWKATTARRPPGLRMRSAAARPSASSHSSSLTKMRKRLERARRRMNCARPRAHHLADDVGERARGADRRFRARRDDGARDRAGMPLLAENRENGWRDRVRRRARPRRPRSARPCPCACRAGRRCGTRSRARPHRAASTRRRDRARRRRRFRGRNSRATRSRSEKRSSTSVSRPRAAATRSAPRAIACWSRSMPITCVPPIARMARL